jgi:hypothetical protein
MTVVFHNRMQKWIKLFFMYWIYFHIEHTLFDKCIIHTNSCGVYNKI